MNHYGALAMQHWSRDRTAEFAQIADKEMFFTTLGERISAEIDLRRTEAERQTGAGQSLNFLENLGTLNQTRLSVEDEVLRELAFIEPGMAS